MSEPVDRDFRGVVEALPMGIFVHRDRRILYANRACADALGVEGVGSLLGRDPLELLAPEDREEHAQRLAALARGEAIQRALGRLAGEGGRSHVAELVDRAVELGGEPAMVTVLHDVSEQRELEEHLRRARKLEDLGKLAVGIAHDFNNLLGVIVSSAGALQDAVRGGSPVDPEAVDDIRRAGERGRDLTRRLLALAQKHASDGRGRRR